MTGKRASDPMTEPTRHKPIRIQRKRSKGWKMPENTVYVGRPTKWGNPFPIDRYLCREGAIVLFELLFGIEPSEPLDNREKFFRSRGDHYPVADVKRELRGKNLACWCSLDELCHADVLLEIANSGASTACTEEE